jgi:hypothetical protein
MTDVGGGYGGLARRTPTGTRKPRRPARASAALGNPRQDRLDRLQNCQHIVEQLWSRAVEAQRSQSQMTRGLTRRSKPNLLPSAAAGRLSPSMVRRGSTVRVR